MKSAGTLTRRGFLAIGAAAGGGLLIGVDLVSCRGGGGTRAAGGDSGQGAPNAQSGGMTGTSAPASSEPVNLGAFVRVAPDDSVTLEINESEMGQGVMTSLAMILADELRADWSQVRSEHAPIDPEAYGSQSTGGSHSVRGNFDRLRAAGAAARAMLVEAAAQRFGVAAAECEAEKGVVTCKKAGKSARFGELCTAAARLEPPAHAPLTDPSKFEIIGTPAPRLDVPDKTVGKAVYGIDVNVPGMVFAQVARCPIFGGTLKSFSADKARAVPGVRDVVEIPSGVAVVADHTWAAMKGREALAIQWNDGGHARLSTESARAACRRAVGKGAVARKDGNAAAALHKAGARHTIRAVYEVPYLAHAPMEPLGATAHVTGSAAQVWAATQSPGPSRDIVAKIAGVPAEKVKIHTMMLGGGFGRRSHSDFVEEAVHLAKKVGKPVKVVWSREDGVTGGFYRPMAYNTLRGAIGADGMPVAWEHHIAGPSILKAFGPLRGGVDRTSVDGAANLPYAIPSVEVTYADVDLPVPVWFWRSVGASINGYVRESFLDELAHKGKRDPLEVRRALLKDNPRHLAVLDLVAGRAGWGGPLPEGHARGVAIVEAFGSVAAQVAEVSIEKQAGKRAVRVHKVVCGVACGRIVNPDTIAAQMDSGVAYGLSAALFGRITLKNGRAVEDNFDTYKVVRMRAMPAVETHVLPLGPQNDTLGGVGEVAVPPTAPAVCNAILALTGKPVRSLPIQL